MQRYREQKEGRKESQSRLHAIFIAALFPCYSLILYCIVAYAASTVTRVLHIGCYVPFMTAAYQQIWTAEDEGEGRGRGERRGGDGVTLG